MTCFVCGKGVMIPYFLKIRENKVQEQFVKCDHCGLVINESLYGISLRKWEAMNYHFHSGYQGTNKNTTDPKWLQRLNEQAKVLSGFFENGIFSESDHTIDYGCGDGKLSEYVNDIYKKKTNNELKHLLLGRYDKYMALGGG